MSYNSRPMARGFTLLELMVVLVILAMLATIAAPQVIKYLGRAKQDTAQVQVDALSAAVDFFHFDLGRYPSEQEGLAALIEKPAEELRWDGPYIKKRDSLIDPWGSPYLYKSPGEHGPFDVFTLGQDKKAGGEGDGRDRGNW